MTIPLGVRRQFIAAFTCSVGVITSGCILAWPAPELKKLRQPDSPVLLDRFQEGWVVSAMYFGKLLSPLPCGSLMHKIGPKRSILVMGVFPIMSWILIYCSTTPTMLITARLLGGLWLGVIQTIVPIYMAEVSEPHVRGIFGSFFLLSRYIGENFMYLLAPFVSIYTTSVVCGMIPIVFLILFSLCPESPYYYIIHKESNSAAKSLNWLRGGASVRSELELELIQISVEKEANKSGKFLRKLVTLMTSRPNRKALVIVGVVSMMEKLCGIPCITAYSSWILPQVGPLTSDYTNIIFSLVSLFSLLLVLCTGLTHRVGRKPLLQLSSFGMGFSTLWIGVWYYLHSGTDFDVNGLSWSLLVGYFVFGCTYSMGLGFIAPIYQGEMFPSNLKGQASALSSMVNALAATVITALFPILTETYGIFVNFFLFSAVGFAISIFTYFVVVETEGKSLQTIQAELNNGKTDAIKKVGESVRLLSIDDNYHTYVY